MGNKLTDDQMRLAHELDAFDQAFPGVHKSFGVAHAMPMPLRIKVAYVLGWTKNNHPKITLDESRALMQLAEEIFKQ